jgi:hypothetical protein
MQAGFLLSLSGSWLTAPQVWQLVTVGLLAAGLFGVASSADPA